MQFIKKIWLLFVIVPTLTLAQATPDTLVRNYILIDATSGQVLEAKAADVETPPASITKLMTAYVVFGALKDGRIHLEDSVTVSKNARAQEGSRMFLEVNTQATVNEMLQGLIVQSGNDAAVALAEYVGGSVDNFTKLMNDAAQKLNMTHSHFMNPTGLPMDGHFMSAKDIATLARAIITEYPQYYHYYSQKEFRWNKITQKNRNRLLFTNTNVDGLKTGHTDAAGYCLTASEKRGDLRLITVVLGAEKEAHRYEATQALLNQGFAQFVEITPLQAGQTLVSTPVYKGSGNSVNVVAGQTAKVVIPVAQKEKIKANVQLDTVVVAPITKGQKLGTITITDGTKTYATIEAVAANDVAQGGFFKRVWDGLKLWWNN